MSQIRDAFQTMSASRAAQRLWTPARAMFDAANPPSDLARTTGASVTWSRVLVEWSVLAFGVLLFCQKILDFGAKTILAGNDTESLQQIDWVFYNAVRNAGVFPLWDPFLRTGWPLIADGFLHIYNPLVGIPILVLGAWDGPKVAVLLSYLAAALGMWWLGKVLGFNSPVRVWMGLSYAFAGQAAARFFEGQYDFVYGFAWFPWAIAGLIAIADSQRRLYIGLAAIFISLIFFSGNAYYGFYMIFVALLLGAAAVARVQLQPRRLSLDLPLARLLVISGVLALAFASIQLVPFIEARGQISKGSDPSLASAHTLQQVWLDYTSVDSRRPDTETFPAREEYYSYVGLIPFILLLLTPLVARRGRRRWLAFFSLLFIGASAYAGLKDMPFGAWYATNDFWTQWRFPTRALLLGSLALIVLGGLGLDQVWKWAVPRLAALRAAGRKRARGVVALGVLGLFAGLMVVSVLDVFAANRRPLDVFDACNPQYQAMAWLREYEPYPSFVSIPQGCHGAVISQNLYYLDGWYGYDLVPVREGNVTHRPIVPGPQYVLVGKDVKPAAPNATLVSSFETNSIYQLPGNLPYAFSVKNDILLNSRTSSPLPARAVKQVTPYTPVPNRIELIQQGAANSTLVVLNSLYPGWKVYVDHQPAPILNAGGYLAVGMRVGIHKYEFVFDPLSFKLGLLISLLGALIIGALVTSDLRMRVALPSVVLPRLRTTTRRLTPRAPVESAPAPAQSAAVLSPTALGEIDLPWLHVRIKWRGLQNINVAQVLPWILFGGAMLVYAVTRLVALDKFPIYFFADEAIETVLARQLVENGLRTRAGQWFPVFFDTYGFQNPLISVYIQVIATTLFGVSVTASRAGPAFVTCLAAGAISLILKLIFKIRYWWAGVLVLGIIPAWFLHSRTVFETAMMTSFYIGFILCYLLYRYRAPRYALAAVVFAALTFYSYGNGQLVIGATVLLLALSDLRYHLKQWRVLALALVLGAVLAFPYLQLRNDHPEEAAYHLRTLNTYLFQKIPLDEKIREFASTYWYGMSPEYWFVPNGHDLARHRLKDYGNILIYTLPLFLVGVGLAFRRIREPRYRTLIIAALAAPIGGAITEIGVTRAMAFVVPVALLTTIGLDWLIGKIRLAPVQSVGPAVVLGVLSFASLFMLNDALTNGPQWFRDYGLYGMQWGAEQIFAAIPPYLNGSPKTRIGISSSWANGADVFLQYFMPNEPRVRMDSLDAYIADKHPLDSDMVFITTPSELEHARESKKFTAIKIEQTIKYPDGTDGFYFVRLAYVNDVDQIFAAEKAERSKPVMDRVKWNGETIKVTHSLFDMGQAVNMFDDDTFTLARGLEANPLLVDIEFPTPRPIKGLAMDFASGDYDLTVSLYADSNAEPVTFNQQFTKLPADPHIEMSFNKPPPQVKRVRILVHAPLQSDPAHIHIREIKFK